MKKDEQSEIFVATYEMKDRVPLAKSKTFAQAGLECCEYVRKYGKCLKIELESVYG